MKKDTYVYIRIEQDWKDRLERLAKEKTERFGEEIKSMWLARKYLKEGILRGEKNLKLRKKNKFKAK